MTQATLSVTAEQATATYGEDKSCARSCVTGLAKFGIWTAATTVVTGASSGLTAACGAAGAFILEAAGHEFYHVLHATQAAAVGGAVNTAGVFGGWLAFTLACNVRLKQERSRGTASGAIAGFTASAALAGFIASAALAGLTGSAILGMDIATSVAASATGAAVIGGSAAVLGLCCGGRREN